jgi:hypothetical protein
MKDFEDRLKGVSRREPSPALDRRVAELFARPRAARATRRRTIRVGWAVAASCLAGLVGFAAGVAWHGPTPPRTVHPAAPVTLQVVYASPGAPNPFDLTSVDDSGMTGPWEVKTHVNGKDQS